MRWNSRIAKLSNSVITRQKKSEPLHSRPILENANSDTSRWTYAFVISRHKFWCFVNGELTIATFDANGFGAWRNSSVASFGSYSRGNSKMNLLKNWVSHRKLMFKKSICHWLYSTWKKLMLSILRAQISLLVQLIFALQMICALDHLDRLMLVTIIFEISFI